MSFFASALLRPRADVRRRLEAWAKASIERLREVGAETYSSLTTEPSLGPEGGSHRVVFVSRGTKAQDAQVHLVLSCAPERVEVGIEAQPGALGSLAPLLADPERGLQLLGALDALPEQFVIGTPEERGPWERASTDEIRRVVDRVGRARPFWLGWVVPRELALAHAASLDEQVQDALVALGPTFALIEGASREAGSDTAPRPRIDPRAPRSSELRDRHASDDDRSSKRRSRNQGRRREREQEAVEAEPEPEMEREREASPRLTRAVRASGSGAGGRRGSLLPRIDPRAPIERGTFVRVMDGPFSGKVGVVQELDGKGGARVLLGLLAVRLEVKDVAACAKGRERPLLSSSHRKPVPARS